jgi:hypothetical protein
MAGVGSFWALEICIEFSQNLNRKEMVRMFAPTSSVLFIINLLCVLLGIIVWQTLYLSTQFVSECRTDYIWAAVKRAKLFIACVVLIELLVGKFLVLPFLFYVFQKFAGSAFGVLEPFFVALLAGVVIAALPKFGEQVLAGLLIAQLGSYGKPIKAAVKPILLLVVWLGEISLQFVGEEIQALLEEDNFDWQDQWDKHSAWFCNLSPRMAGRATRIVYEFYKLHIAIKRKDPTFLDYSIDRFPGDKFYLIAKHLGRKKSLKTLQNPPHFENWDGPERRQNKRPDNPGRRIGDDPETRRLIKLGKYSK